MIMNFEMRFACLLIFANKMDLPHSLSVEEVTSEVRVRPRARCPRPAASWRRALPAGHGAPRGRARRPRRVDARARVRACARRCD